MAESVQNSIRRRQMSQRSEFTFRKRRRQAARAAEELHYPAELVEEIKTAETDEEIDMALARGRHMEE